MKITLKMTLGLQDWRGAFQVIKSDMDEWVYEIPFIKFH